MKNSGNKKRNPKFWFKNEKELMKSIGLNPVPGSGNGAKKEDGQNDYIIAQLKSTEADQTTIKLQDINTLYYHAAVSHKTPLFINQFINGPILLSIRLEDLEDVYNYLTKKVIKKRETSIIKIYNKNDSVIKSSKNRDKIKQKLKNESCKIYKRREK